MKLTNERIAEITKRKDAAWKMVSALCKPSFEEGSRRWVMSIPAQPDHDPDLVISASLRDLSDLLEEREELVAKLMSASASYNSDCESCRENFTAFNERRGE